MQSQCQHFPQCGGCQFQDLSAEQERQLKEDKFLGAMRAHGLDATIKGFEISPLKSRRRASLSAKRTKKSAMMGFTETRTHTIVDMQMCLILDPAILALKPHFMAMMPIVASRSATLKFHITKLAHGFDLEIENAKEIDAPKLQSLAHICSQAHIHRLLVNGEKLFQDTPAQIQIGNSLVTVPPHPFLQATQHAEATLRNLAHKAVKNAKSVADLFAGLGTFSYGLTMPTKSYEGAVELSEAMQSNLNQLGAHNIEAVTRDLFRDPLMPNELSEFEAVIIDPPRAGARSQCEALADSEVPIIAFVSCDPGTFARDAEILVNGGYKMQPVTLIDQFRFSNHIESFTVFEKLR